jgi:predicted deacylase
MSPEAGAGAKFLSVPIKKGEIVRERVPVGELADGSPVALPVMTIGGVKDGPTLYLQAGIHGDEATGIEVCRRAIAEIDPQRLSGAVVAIPVANVPAYLTRTRGYLHEERWLIDMNRIFPGSATGLLTERIAAALFHQFVAAADFSIDLHSALDGCDILPFVYINPDDDVNGTYELRHKYGWAFGTPYVYHKAGGTKLGTSDMTRSISAQADSRGLAMISAEMGESRRVSHNYVPIGVRGVRNVMASMGMIDAEPEQVESQRKFSEITLVHASHGGGVRMAVDLADPVTAGQPIAEVVDVYGSVVETVTSPVDGFVLRAMRLASVSTGAELAWIAS